MKASVKGWLPARPAVRRLWCAELLPMPYERDRVRLHVVGVPRLALIGGLAHPLVRCVDPLREPNASDRKP
jgi:hypothetical protein